MTYLEIITAAGIKNNRATNGNLNKLEALKKTFEWNSSEYDLLSSCCFHMRNDIAQRPAKRRRNLEMYVAWNEAMTPEKMFALGMAAPIERIQA